MPTDKFTFNPFVMPQTAAGVQGYGRKMEDVATAVAAIQRDIDARGWEGLAFDASNSLGNVTTHLRQIANDMTRVKADLDARILSAQLLSIFSPFPLAEVSPGESGKDKEGGEDGEGENEPWDGGSPKTIMDPEVEAEMNLKLAEKKAHSTFGPNFDWNHTFGSKDNGLSVDAHALQGNLDANAGIGIGKDGLTMDAGASAAFDLLAALAKVHGTVHAGPVTMYGDAQGAAKVDARAGAKGDLGFKPGEVSAGVDAQAFAGAEAQASADVGAKVAGVDTKVGASAGALAGAGAWAKGDASVGLTHIKASLDLGVAVGVGLNLKVNVDVDASGAVHTVEHGAEHVVSKVGHVLNPLNW